MSRWARWHYPIALARRDLRFDFLRGLAILSLVTAHFEAFNWSNFVFWERLGVVTGAEMFVMAAGLVLGQIFRYAVDQQQGMEPVAQRLLRRAFELYRAQVGLVLVVMAVAALGWFDMTAVSTFTDRFAGKTYPLLPDPGSPWHVQLGQVLLLQRTPHQIQIQILSLYVVLMLVSPLFVWLLKVRLLGVYVALTWAVYFAGWLSPVDYRLLNMQFEYAFPLPNWQLLYAHALLVGYFRKEIGDWLARGRRRALVATLCVVLALAFFMFAQATANPSFPAWSRLELMAPETFQHWYDAYFGKNRLGPGRVLNAAVLFAALYALLTWFWQPMSRLLGWLLIPLGESSLYVFLMHVPFLFLIDQLPGYFDGVASFESSWPYLIWINTALYAGIILGLWALVRGRVLFSVIPR
ncbi:OpgC domain-containing protein [Azohydromonas caseinilytica]|uniref:Succinyl transferase OpgC n=1 Tax=Azohydromonas caseinilytica TaxID=2728836 RepID=A0A848FBV4_9BURK|nr:OpgC domain-containing protein [Azohydromonas caseinilytica]NML16396.1 succinyl transferase OpgC [Azohydromonas caseinilytica]